MSKYDDLLQRMKGPVYPVLPAFAEDLSMDLDATKAYVRYLNDHSVRTLMLTAGTSRYNLLSEDEISRLNRAMVEANDGKAITIVANPMTGPTFRAREFAKEAEAMGADILLVYYPERYYNDDQVYDYFASICEAADVGVMIHAYPMRSAVGGGTTNYSVDLCRRLSEIDNMVGMKEEHINESHRYKLAANLEGKFNLTVAGESMRMFMGCQMFGVDSYLVGVGSFKPQIEEDFYRNLMAGNTEAAFNAVHEIEEPFFDTAKKIGWHIAMKATLDLLGLMPDRERPPLPQVTDEQRAMLRTTLQQLGWLQ